ncbi:hydrogenase iron-sulfur subunit [Desulfobacterales bacterium HSG17]|nr:hydrogenase iron-sulfur subunit [Desulfobacterales bacterium HSG17]
MHNNPKVGVFLCECGQKIEPLIDLPAIQNAVANDANVVCCKILPYTCLNPGMEQVIQCIKDNGLNRMVVAGCESRLILNKFERQLESEGMLKGQIDIVNLRGHVAAVNDGSKKQRAEKGIKLVRAAVAGMAALPSGVQTNVTIKKPPIIVGGGIASFAAAHELATQKIDCLLSLPETNPEIIMGEIHKSYPGERSNYGRLRKIMDEVLADSHVQILPRGELVKLSGITGDFGVTFSVPGKTSEVKYEAGLVIACLDSELEIPGPEFGHDGQSVVCQTEFEEDLLNHHIPSGQTVFWISDYETGQAEYAGLSTRSAWSMARYMRENSDTTRVVILYNEQMPLPITTAEKAVGRKLGIIWVPYDKAVQPILQSGLISFGSTRDHMEYELPWDQVVLSPIHQMGAKTLQTSQVLGIVHGEEFLGTHHAKVRPEMVGREETYLAGSARHPCDLTDALAQGRNAGKKNAEMMKNSTQGLLFVPQVVCVVDPVKCVGCGQCQELCDCGGIGIADSVSGGGGLPRVVDPMLCTGGGTCAAACPYEALTLQNNTNDQKESRVASLARHMAADEFVAFACSWAGLPAADNAGNMGLTYDPRAHILGVPCIGQIDISVMARVFMEGSSGLLLVGCVPEDCHHSFGVDHAWSRVNLMKKLFAMCGFERQRITLAHADLNQPEEFIRTVESYTKMLNSLGPIEKSPENQKKLENIYELVKHNSRVRLLLSCGLRRPWEKAYRGDQRFALAYDRDDFMTALKEEYLNTEIKGILKTAPRSFGIGEIAKALSEKESRILTHLTEMASEGLVDTTHGSGGVLYVGRN